MRIQNPKFNFIQKRFSDNQFKLLDIGAGNKSARKITSLFPNCEYHGLDIDRSYNNAELDFKLMKEFYELDLTKLDYSIIPDNYFDAILIAHVIEHLFNGDEVIKSLVPKLRSGGYMYVEYPGKRSTKLPSMRGTLNFYDDGTHVRIYTIPELSHVFQQLDCEVIEKGTRRSYFLLIVTPIRIIFRWIRGKAVTGNIFWDLLGFAEYITIRKK